MIFTLFLARLLVPEDFGLIAMMMVFFELTNVLIESGMGQALIRSKEVSDSDLSTVFYMNLGICSVSYILLYLGAPYIAKFYNQPLLTSLVRISGLVVFFNAVKVVQIAVLSRQMNFREQMRANTLGVIGSGIIAVLAAYMGAGVWSLVAQLLASASISAIILWSASSWRPGLEFSGESFKRLFGFGSHLLAEGFLTILFQNSYLLVIGRLFSAEATGLYFFARKISQLMSEQLTGAVQQATYPALATLQDDDEVLKRKYRVITQLLMFVVAPVMFFLAAVAEPMFDLLFDDKWQGAVFYLQLLSIIGVLYPLHAMNINILNVKGRSDLVLKVGLIKKTVGLLLLIVSIPFGVFGIVLGQIIGSILALIPNVYFSNKLINYGPKVQLIDAFKPVLIALIAAISTRWITSILQFHIVVNTFIGLCFGLIIYIFCSWLLKSEGLLWLTNKMNRRLRCA